MRIIQIEKLKNPSNPFDPRPILSNFGITERSQVGKRLRATKQEGGSGYE